MLWHPLLGLAIQEGPNSSRPDGPQRLDVRQPFDMGCRGARIVLPRIFGHHCNRLFKGWLLEPKYETDIC